MPAMVRWEKEANKIVFNILGKPANFKPRTERERWIDKRLFFEETYRVR
jgi:hypothetical protein